MAPVRFTTDSMQEHKLSAEAAKNTENCRHGIPRSFPPRRVSSLSFRLSGSLVAWMSGLVIDPDQPDRPAALIWLRREAGNAPLDAGGSYGAVLRAVQVAACPQHPTGYEARQFAEECRRRPLSAHAISLICLISRTDSTPLGAAWSSMFAARRAIHWLRLARAAGPESVGRSEASAAWLGGLRTSDPRAAAYRPLSGTGRTAGGMPKRRSRWRESSIEGFTCAR